MIDNQTSIRMHLLRGVNHMAQETMLSMDLPSPGGDAGMSTAYAIAARMYELVQKNFARQQYGCDNASLGLEEMGVPSDLCRVLSSIGTLLCKMVDNSAGVLPSIAVACEKDVFRVALYCRDEFWLARVGHAMSELIRVVFDPAVTTAGKEEVGRLERILRQWHAELRKHALLADTVAVVRVARSRGIPCQVLGGGIVQLGEGRYQHRLRASTTDETNFIATKIASDKSIATNLLRASAIPVPRQHMVNSEDEALSAAEHIGFPVVVKPVRGSEGRGVSVNLSSQHAVSLAYRHATILGSSVLVESFVQGNDYRILVVNGCVVAAAQRIPAHVIGDGISTIRELVAEENRRPERNGKHLYKLKIDEIVENELARQGYSPESVPENKSLIILRANANFSTGGTAVDVTDLVHPDNKALAVRAASVVGLDVAGVDLIAPDIGQSHKHMTCAICEVNSMPGLRLHYDPYQGVPRDVASAIVEMLYPGGAACRVPVVAVLGDHGKQATIGAADHLLTATGDFVGVSANGVVKLGPEAIDLAETPHHKHVRMVLADKRVDVVLCEVSGNRLMNDGLGIHQPAVAVLTGEVQMLSHNRKGNALLSRVLSAAEQVVVNVDTGFGWESISQCRREQTWAVSVSPDMNAIKEHLASGGRAVVLVDDGNTFSVSDGQSLIALMQLHDIPALSQGAGLKMVQMVAMAISVGLALGRNTEQIKCGLRTLDSDRVNCFLNPTAEAKSRNNAASVTGRPLWYGHEIALATGGRWLYTDGSQQAVSGVCYYPNQISRGDVVLTTTPEFWGKKYPDTTGDMGSMFARGAAIVVTDRVPDAPDYNRHVLLVDNTRAALDALGRYARGRFMGKVVCVTGSAGKSTTKELLRFVLARQAPTKGSKKNFNHGPGVPLSLAETPMTDSYGVYEFAVDVPSVTRPKALIARPHVAIITTIQPDHLMYYRTMEALADQKSLLFDGLVPGGVIVLNRDCEYYVRLRKRAENITDRIITFGKHPEADVHLLLCHMTESGSSVRAAVGNETVSFSLCLPGQHMVMNALATLAATWALGADVIQAATDLASFHGLEHRLERKHIYLQDGYFELIDDAFSANPASIRAGLDVLRLIKPHGEGRRIAILGEIHELGPSSPDIHAGLADAVLKSGVARLYTLGKDMLHLRRVLPDRILGSHGATGAEIVREIVAEIRPGDIVLVKGSRRTADSTRPILDALEHLGQSVPIAETGVYHDASVSEIETGFVRVPLAERKYSKRLEIVLAGDTSIGENYRAARERTPLGDVLCGKPYDYPMQNMRALLRSADVAIVNLETPLTNLAVSPFSKIKDYVHWSDIERAPACLRTHNIRVVGLANNHSYDYGAEGLEQTLDVLEKHNIVYFGAGRTRGQASRPLLIEATLGNKTWRMAVIAAFEDNALYRKRYDCYANHEHGGIHPLDEKAIVADIERIKGLYPDALIAVYPHWGKNYCWRTEPQRKMAAAYIEAGADVIIGHGAHMLQQIERISGKWVFYGIGNFIFCAPGRYQKQNSVPYSLVARLVAEAQLQDVSVYLRFYPIISDNLKTSYQPRMVNDGEFATVCSALFSHAALIPTSLQGRDEYGHYLQFRIS